MTSVFQMTKDAALQLNSFALTELTNYVLQPNFAAKQLTPHLNTSRKAAWNVLTLVSIQANNIAVAISTSVRHAAMVKQPALILLELVPPRRHVVQQLVKFTAMLAMHARPKSNAAHLTSQHWTSMKIPWPVAQLT